MADVATSQQLLIDALQDLHDAERALVERLDGIADAVEDDGVAANFREISAAASGRVETVAALANQLGDSANGADNIWMRSVLDDAERDIETVTAGRLRDIALVGALRKGVQSARVSYETVVMLGPVAGEDMAAARCKDFCADYAQSDDRLREALVRLTQG